MPRGSKSKYSAKQKRQAEDIAEGYESRGTPTRRAKAIGWATVNKSYGGGTRGGSGHKRASKTSSRRGGHRGGAASASRSASARSASARKAARTRARRSR